MPLPYDVARARIARVLSVTDPDHVKKLVLEIEAGTISLPLIRRTLRERVIEHLSARADRVSDIALALQANPRTVATVVSELGLDGTAVVVGKGGRQKLWRVQTTTPTRGSGREES